MQLFTCCKNDSHKEKHPYVQSLQILNYFLFTCSHIINIICQPTLVYLSQCQSPHDFILISLLIPLLKKCTKGNNTLNN